MAHITPISYIRFEKFLRSVGCTFDRQEGDHLIYKKSGLNRPIVFPKIKDIPKFIILNNLRTLKIGREKYLKIISNL